MGPDDVYLSYLPLPHIYEKVNQVMTLPYYIFFTLVIILVISFPWCKVSKPTSVCVPIAFGHQTTELVIVKRTDQGPSTWRQAQDYLHKHNIFTSFAQIDMQAIGSREISYGKLSWFGTVHKTSLVTIISLPGGLPSLPFPSRPSSTPSAARWGSSRETCFSSETTSKSYVQLCLPPFHACSTESTAKSVLLVHRSIYIC